MADRKDYKMIAEELVRQGWGVEQTTRGHYKAVPPDPQHNMVHFSHSDDHHALLNIIRDLRKRGFVWPPPSKKDLAVERREEATTAPPPKLCGECHQPLDPDFDHECLAGPPPPPPPPETPEVRMDRLFNELKDAKTLYALTEEQFVECRRKVEEATRALTDAERERNAAAEALKAKKAEFDHAFENAA